MSSWQRHHPGGALQRRLRWQVHRRDPLLRLEFAHQGQWTDDARSGPLVDRELWHWSRDTQLREYAHRYRETNGVQIMATLSSLAMNALRLDGFWSISEGFAAVSHDC
jgi:hypothetical protein